MTPDATWAGVDVGGTRKGFDLAVLDAALRVQLFRSCDVDELIELIADAAPMAIGIDAPRNWADPGERSRRAEREFMRLGLCGIRFSPDEATARARHDAYFEWIWNGLELWTALGPAATDVVEVFPTASWTAWFGPRGDRRRARWTRDAIDDLGGHGVTGLEAVRNQDQRDAVAAALTARQWTQRPLTVDVIDGFVVPSRGSHPIGELR